MERVSDQLVDPAAGAVFLLVSKTNTPVRGPWVLCRISLATEAVRRGPTFPVGSLAMASGYLWVYGAPRPGARPVVSEVNPVTLERVRPIPLPPAPVSFGGAPVAVTAGPAGSVWFASYRTLLRVNVSTGAPLTRVTLPPGLGADDVSVDPAGIALYLSAVHVVRGGFGGLVMFEYDARTGRKLATAAGGLIHYSVAGASLTAVPGGVWVSFRTGMMGLTIHLSANGLRMIAPPGPRIARTPPTGVFHFPMDEAVAYGGGALWLATLRIMACIDPQTGKVRASERVGQSPGATNHLIYQFQAINAAAHVVDGLSVGGLLQVTPPHRCWR